MCMLSHSGEVALPLKNGLDFLYNLKYAFKKQQETFHSLVKIRRVSKASKNVQKMVHLTGPSCRESQQKFIINVCIYLVS